MRINEANLETGKAFSLIPRLATLVCAAALLGALPASAQSHPHPLFGPPPPPLSGSKAGSNGGAHSSAPSVLPSPPPTARLKAETRVGEESAGAGAVRWSAGIIVAGSESHVDHTFTLKNVSAAPVTLSRLRGSCGCETLILKKNGAEAKTTTLAPGEAAQVKVSVALREGQDGEMHKFAWAYGPDPNSPPLETMEIAMNVRLPVVFTPTVLDFGTLTVGEARSVPVTVTADTAALAGGPIPTPQAAGVSVTSDGPEAATVRDGHPSRSRRFKVTLAAPAEAGPLTGRLTMPAGSPPGLASAGIPLTGTISGNLTAQPRSLFFGAVPAGKGVTREASLSQAAGNRGKALLASSDKPWLTARVRAQPGANSVLEVTLQPNAPVGVVQTQVVVTSSSGERLSIPIVGEVLSAGH